VSDNRIERFNGTVTERNKVMRAIKKSDSPIIEGQRIYYNHIRPHVALKGEAPAEAAGIDLQLEGNKWDAITKKASRRQCPV